MICEEERLALIRKSLEGGLHLMMHSGRKLVVVATMPAMIADAWIGVYLDTGEPVTLHLDGVVEDAAGDQDTPIDLWCYKKAEFKGWRHINPEYTEVSVRLLENGSMEAVFDSIRAQKEATILLCPKTVTNLSTNPKTILRP